MSFKDILYAENDQVHGSLDPSEKKALFERSKLYIFIQDLLAEIKTELADGETIEGYLPMNVTENIAATNQGIGGMAYARTEKAKAYVKNFHDTRGNRLFIFTNRRIIFLTIIDYLEDHTYYSYPYDQIHSIYLAPRKMTYHEFQGFKKKTHTWYYLDFQAGNHIFTETLTEKDAAIFKENWQKIPAMKQIPQDNKVYRKNYLDFILSNFQLFFRIGYLFNFLFILLFVLILLGTLFGIGPMKFMYFRELFPASLAPWISWLKFPFLH